jgi:hypothetical protein
MQKREMRENVHFGDAPATMHFAHVRLPPQRERLPPTHTLSPSRHTEPLPPPGGGRRSRAALTSPESGDRRLSSALQHPNSQSECRHPASGLSRADRRSSNAAPSAVLELSTTGARTPQPSPAAPSVEHVGHARRPP